jgi:hypothetical protein
MSEGRFAGVDWASEEHAVCVVDGRGRILGGSLRLRLTAWAVADLPSDRAIGSIGEILTRRTRAIRELI